MIRKPKQKKLSKGPAQSNDELDGLSTSAVVSIHMGIHPTVKSCFVRSIFVDLIVAVGSVLGILLDGDPMSKVTFGQLA